VSGIAVWPQPRRFRLIAPQAGRADELPRWERAADRVGAAAASRPLPLEVRAQWQIGPENGINAIRSDENVRGRLACRSRKRAGAHRAAPDQGDGMNQCKSELRGAAAVDAAKLGRCPGPAALA